MGTLRGWLTLKIETNKNREASIHDMERAMEAVKEAENRVVAFSDRLDYEEKRLEERAAVLRRKSSELFKFVPERRKTTIVVDVVEQIVDGQLQMVQISSL